MPRKPTDLAPLHCFDAAPRQSCAMAGGGAIPQTADNAVKAKLETVVAQVRSGIGNNDVAAAKKIATDAQTALNKIQRPSRLEHFFVERRYAAAPSPGGL